MKGGISVRMRVLGKAAKISSAPARTWAQTQSTLHLTKGEGCLFIFVSQYFSHIIHQTRAPRPSFTIPVLLRVQEVGHLTVTSPQQRRVTTVAFFKESYSVLGRSIVSLNSHHNLKETLVQMSKSRQREVKSRARPGCKLCS